MPMRVDRLLLTGVAGLLLLGEGCAGAVGTARQSFSRFYNCPEPRVVVSKEQGRPYLAPPPPEIAGDPERLALYQHKDEVVWLARGCNEQAYYRCYRPILTEPAWQCDFIAPPRWGR